MIKYFFLFVLFTTGFKAFAQHDPSDLIESDEWNIIGSIKTKYLKPGATSVVFPAQIKKYEKKPFELEGYMIPIRVGAKQTRFLLSSLPINQCFYCGKNGVPMMVMVEMAEPIPISKETILVRGILNLSSAANSEPVVLSASKKIGD